MSELKIKILNLGNLSTTVVKIKKSIGEYKIKK